MDIYVLFVRFKIIDLFLCLIKKYFYIKFLIFFQEKVSEYGDMKNHTLIEHGGYLSSEFSAGN